MSENLLSVEVPSAKLSVKNLYLGYENLSTGTVTNAVEDISIDIKPGEFVTIVGLSGCGKSTFLNAIAGIIKPSKGTIAINEKPVNGPGQDRTVVFQKASLLPWRSVVGNITYGLELRGIKKEEAISRAQECIELVRLQGFEHFYANQLSGGMQQRVNLARALVCEPEVLLLDEPFAALDAITRESMQNELLQIWEKTKKTVLMVTHQIDEAVLLSDRVIIFSAKPAKILKEIPINLPRPRTPGVRNSVDFDYVSKKIWSHIYSSAGKEGEIEYAI